MSKPTKVVKTRTISHEEWLGAREKASVAVTVPQCADCPAIECRLTFCFRRQEATPLRPTTRLWHGGTCLNPSLVKSLPAEWFLQVQNYLAVTELSKAQVVVLIGGNKLQSQVIERDEEKIQTLIALESQFCGEYDLKDRPPPVSEKDSEKLSLLYPTSKESRVILPAEANEFINQWLEIKKAEDDIKTAKTSCENKLKALLKEAETGTAPNGYTVSWKSNSQSRLDSIKLKAAYPDIAVQNTTTVAGSSA